MIAFIRNFEMFAKNMNWKMDTSEEGWGAIGYEIWDIYMEMLGTNYRFLEAKTPKKSDSGILRLDAKSVKNYSY